MQRFATTLLLFLLLDVWWSSAACGQIAPTGDDAPSLGNGTALSRSAMPRPAPKETSVTVLGWSFSNENDQAHLLHGSDVTLDPGHPEIILFYQEAEPAPAGLEFRYRLNGYDSGWTVTHERLAHYRRLSPGSYLFQVEAHVAGEPWPPHAPTALPVQQKPFFYQTWYASVLVGMVLLGVAVQLLKQRDQLLKGQMGIVLQERNRIASECHDTLMAGFAAISWQLEATARLFGEALPGKHPAAQSCELARSMVAHCQAEARRIIWDLRDSDEITNSLSRALLDATSAWRQRESPQTTLEVHGNEIAVSPGAVHHLVCIGQEAVTNAIRHGRPTSIRIELAYGEDSLRLLVHDDGRGFHVSDRSVRAGHFGIPVMEERARKLGGTLHLLSSAAAGTEVSVTVSFQQIHQPAAQQQDLVKWIGI